MSPTMRTGTLGLLIALCSASAAQAAPKICEETIWKADDGKMPDCKLPDITNGGGPDHFLARVKYSEEECEQGKPCTKLDMEIWDKSYGRFYCSMKYGQTDYMCYASANLIDWAPFHESDYSWWDGTSTVTSVYCECQ